MKREPKIGEKIYVPSHFSVFNPEDEFAGGMATINKITKVNDEIKVGIKEREGILYTWANLIENQKKWTEEYKGEIAHPDPDIVEELGHSQKEICAFLRRMIESQIRDNQTIDLIEKHNLGSVYKAFDALMQKAKIFNNEHPIFIHGKDFSLVEEFKSSKKHFIRTCELYMDARENAIEKRYKKFESGEAIIKSMKNPNSLEEWHEYFELKRLKKEWGSGYAILSILKIISKKKMSGKACYQILDYANEQARILQNGYPCSDEFFNFIIASSSKKYFTCADLFY